MLARFLHLADVHLGTLHYGSRERARDFGRTLQQVADYAIEQQVNFVLIAGDLFDRAAIDAATHDDAHGVFWRLRRAKIPLFITEGNHDRPRNRDEKSWI
ncbi:MAG: metallophosphoesterase, partial [Chloroflexi bacterium]|nr:metallophosphoesterase [Chloroflexota bacterium]